MRQISGTDERWRRDTCTGFAHGEVVAVGTGWVDSIC